jgi:hypothetical protein
MEAAASWPTRAITRWLYRLFLENPPAHRLLLQLYLGSEAFHHRFPWFNKPDLVEDPELRLLMKQHFADEDNHAKYFALALTLKGDAVVPPPRHLDYLVNLASAFWDAGILVGEAVEELTGPKLFTERQNLFVQLAFKDLSEKKASGDFHAWRDLAKTRDPETYAILKRVVEDEDWHVHIFDAQVAKFLADPHLGPHLQGVYKRLIEINTRVGNAVGANILDHMLDHDLLAVPRHERAAIRALAKVQRKAGGPLPTATVDRFLALQSDYYVRHAEAAATAAP